MSTASATESEDWELVPEGHRAASLIVEWNRSARVFPWHHFVFAVGNGDKVDLRFAKQVITVTGKQLGGLLRAFAEHRVIRLIQPTPNEAKFDVRKGSVRQTDRPTISEIRINGKSECQAAKDAEDKFDEDDEIPEEEQ